MFFSIFLFFGFLDIAYGSTNIELTKTSSDKKMITYSSPLNESLECSKQNDCFVFIPSFGHSHKVELNEFVIADLQKGFYAYSGILYPLPSSLILQKNVLKLTSFTRYGQNQIPRNHLDAYVGSYSDLFYKYWISWFLKTGLSLFSIYTLTLFLVLFLLILVVDHSLDVLALAAYSFVAILYLTSFSELPRSFINPEISAGIIHFLLRLLQDYTLFLLFYNFYRHKNKYVLKFVSFLYAIPLIFMIVNLFEGKVDYSTHLSIIMYCAPLVAFPMGYALIMSLRIPNKRERSVLVIVSSLLFIFQVNDLLVFWSVFNSYFTVKFYVPLIVLLLFYLYLTRRVREYRNREVLTQQSKLAVQLAHDIRSPISAIESVIGLVVISDELKSLFDMSFSRIKNIADSILPGSEKITLEDIRSIIDEILPMKEKEYPNLQLCFESEIEYPLVNCQKLAFERVISNLINNSVEAEATEVTIRLSLIKEELILNLIDNGLGMPESLILKISSERISWGKKSGTGIGLSSMVEMIKECNATHEITSSPQGTCITLKFKVP